MMTVTGKCKHFGDDKTEMLVCRLILGGYQFDIKSCFDCMKKVKSSLEKKLGRSLYMLKPGNN